MVNLHHGLGMCRKSAWDAMPAFFKERAQELSFREVSTIQSIYRYVLTSGTSLSLTELAERIHLKKAVTSLLVSSLVDKGMVIRKDAVDNRRKVTISLTEDGLEMAEGIAAVADKYLDAYLSPLTDAERKALVDIAEKLNPEHPF